MKTLVKTVCACTAVGLSMHALDPFLGGHVGDTIMQVVVTIVAFVVPTLEYCKHRLKR